MCVEISNTNSNMEYNTYKKSKAVYTIKKVLKAIFKKQQQKENKIISVESLESIDNLKNLQMEINSLEMDENAANEKICAASLSEDEYFYNNQEEDIVPVHFARTEHGTFFWTATTAIVSDADLIQPVYCSTSNQLPIGQFQDRWAQA